MGFLRKSIFEIHQALLDNLVTPEELVREALNKAHKDTNNSFEFISDEFAYEQLKNLKNIDKNNILWGIPFAVKDNFSTKDIPTCGSSNILEGYIPSFTAEAVNRLLSQGAILIGKTTLDEFGMGGHGKSGHKGYVYNPWDSSHRREVGGSSSGSAASVAAGIVPFSLGTDTGDSVRRPASLACLVGFKPSWGRISRYGLFPFAPSLDHVAFFTRNVKDSALLLKHLSGKDEKDGTSAANLVENYDLNLNQNLSGKRLAVLKEIYDCMPDNEVRKAFDSLLNQLENKGCKIEFVEYGYNLCKAIFPTYFVISSSEATSNLACLDGIEFGKRVEDDDYETSVIKTRTQGFSEQIRQRLIFGSLSLQKENFEKIYVKAQKIRNLIATKANEILKEFDAIIMPASPNIAPNFDAPSDTSEKSEIAENWLAIANFAGLPSITVPTGFSNGMPFGINLTCKLFDEQGALNLASGIENICGIKDLSVK